MLPNSPFTNLIRAALGGQNLVVEGVPGAGKSHFIIELARQFPHQIVVLTFNRELRGTLREMAQQAGVHNLKIYTYHGYFGGLLNATNYDPTNQGLNDLALLQRYAQAANLQPLATIPLLILDEFQNATLTTLIYLQRIVPHAHQLIALGDPAAVTNAHGGADARYLDKFAAWFPHRHFTRWTLRISHRLPLVVANFVNYLTTAWGATHADLPHPPLIQGEVRGGSVTYLAHMDPEITDDPGGRFYLNDRERERDAQNYATTQANFATIKAWIYDRLVASDYAFSELVIIISNRKSHPVVNALKQWFIANNWPFFYPDHRRPARGFAAEMAHRIRFLTPQAAQGLTARNVVVLDFSWVRYTGRPAPDLFDGQLWVALTRTCENLLVVETINREVVAGGRFGWLPTTMATDLARLGVTYIDRNPSLSPDGEEPSLAAPRIIRLSNSSFRHLYLPIHEQMQVENTLREYEIVRVVQVADRALVRHLPTTVKTHLAFNQTVEGAGVAFNDGVGVPLTTNVTPLNAAFFLNELLDSLFFNWYHQVYDDFPRLVNVLLEGGVGEIDPTIIPKTTLFLQRLATTITPNRPLERATKLRIITLARWLRGVGQFSLFNEIAWDDYHWLDRVPDLSALILRAQITLTLDEESDFFLFPKFQTKINEGVMKRFQSMFHLPPLANLSISLDVDLVKQNRLYDFVSGGAEIGLNAELKMLFTLLILNEFSQKDWYDDNIFDQKPTVGYIYNIITGELRTITYHRRAALEIFQSLLPHMVGVKFGPGRLSDTDFVEKTQEILGSGLPEWLNKFRQKFFS